MALAEFPNDIDATRIAVTGFSGGGQKSFMAAAWSGKTLPLAGFVTDYPDVRAVAPEIAGLAQSETAAPGGNTASDHMTVNQPDPAVLAALSVEDYATFSSLVDQPFFDDMVVELMASDVPILGMWAAQDTKIVNVPSLDVFTSLPMTKRLHLSTGGHETVKTTHERDVQHELRRRWFDRFLKDIQNGVELEPFAEVGVQPSTNADHANLSTVWEHRNTAQWPPAIAPTRFYLRTMRALDPTPPPAVETGPTVAHRVFPGFGLSNYIALGSGRNPAAQQAFIPMATVRFDTPVFPEAAELIGRPSVRLHVNDSTGVFQLSAMLTHVDANGNETWITMGTAGCRAGSAGQHMLQIELDDVAHVIPGGHYVRLRVLNLADHDPPGSGHRIRVLPYFTDTDTQVRMEPGAESGIDLPLRPYQSNMLPRIAEVSSTALSHQLDLRGGAQRAGYAYITFCSASGEAPGVTLPGFPTIPINPDAWTLGSINSANSILFPMSVGVLDADGNATPGFSIPMPVSTAFAGFRFTFAAAILDTTALFESVGGPTTLLITP